MINGNTYRLQMLVKILATCVVSMSAVSCKPSASSEKANTGGGKNKFNGSCSMITRTSMGSMNTIEECWEMYDAPSENAANATCAAANMNYGGTTVTATFSSSACRRTSPMMICKVPFVKDSYEILFQYTQTTSCNKGTPTSDPRSR